MKKRLAYVLACSLLLSQLPATTFAATSEGISGKGNLEVTLNLDYPIVDYSGLGLKAVLLKDGKVVQEMPLNSQVRAAEGDSSYVVFEDLPLGTYQVRLMGEGYKTYTSEDIELVKTEKHLVVNAGNNTFTVGDVNSDGKIDHIDLTQLEAALGTSDLSYDLNGDKVVDVEDLAQLYWSQTATGEASIYNTKMILSKVLDEAAVEVEFKDVNGSNVTVSGEIHSLFDGDDTTTVELYNSVPITEEAPIKIPVSFTEKMNVSEISITAPAESAPTAGYVVYEDTNGEIVRQAFTSVETYALAARTGRSSANKVVKINLGKQVPIQKLTIEVTETSKENGLLASISKIEFLEDVVDNAINQELGLIKGFTGKAQDKGVSLSWNQTSNVTGYKVHYGTEPGVYEETHYTGTNNITIEGLENFTPYYFAVQAVNGDWEGPLSNEITLTPEPQQKPSAPTEVNVGSFDKAIKVSFRIGKEATGANLYYKKVTDREYTKVEDVKSGAMLKNLENDTEYMIYVTATNNAGESSPSAVVKAVPVAEEIIIPEIPTVGRIDNSHITEITLLDNNNVDMKFYPEGFNITNIIDGDFNTHWTAATYQRTRGFSATFDDSYEMDYVAVVPRLDSDLDRYEGTRKYWHYPNDYLIKIWETLDSEPKTVISRTKIPNIGKDGLMILPFEKTKVAKIEVQLFEWDGAGNMSLSEVMFYEYQDMIERIENIFANGTFTAVKEGVTVEEIESLIAQLDALEGAVLWVDKAILREELVAAKEILTAGTPSNLGEMVEVVQIRQKATAQSQNFAAGGLSDLQAAGVMAYANDEILVYVDAPAGGSMPELVVSQFYGDGTWSKTISLKQGRNVIQVPQLVHYNGDKGGPLYLRYTGNEQDATTVRIVHAKKIPTLELTSLEDEATVKAAVTAYVRELTAYVATLDLSNKTKNPANSTELGTDKVLLSLPAEEVYNGLTSGIEGDLAAQAERLYESLMTWDANMKLHYDILGLTEEATEAKHRYPLTRMNVRYMPMNNGVFMYAAGDHIGIQYSSGAALVKGDRSAESGYFGWGINHEIGHIINDSKFIVGETTNNIFALFAQTINGGKSRLETSDIYTDVYKKVVSKNTGFASNVFVNLGMFWQLHLAYDDSNTSVEAGDFYPTLHRLSRDLNLQGLDVQNYFIRLASDAAQKDLTPFFERWGLHISDETYTYTSKYEKETRALYYLNDEAMRYRLEGKAGMAEGSTVSVDAAIGEDANDKVVTLTMTSDIEDEDILGYEIYRDGELIAFTTESTYVDEISANNVTHTYSVVAYDKLLNTTDKAYTEEVYIAAEGTLAKSEYTIERTTASSLQIVLPAAPEVVGLKFTDVTSGVGTDYTVEVSQNGEDWAQAKQSQLKEGTTLIYFNKPGMGEEDDRIWTYDAMYIRITSEAIEDLSDAQIDVLAYPGDGVYFIEDAIGFLGHDYDFGSGTIEEGTLVVMGTYRGHPVYSKIVLSAEYVNEKDFDVAERPGYDNKTNVEAVEGELYMLAELPEDEEVSKVGNGIWIFVPKAQTLPAQIKANMFRTDAGTSVEGGRLVSDTKWQIVPSKEDMPIIEFTQD